MTRVVWDEIAERTYFAGVDRGVIYPADGSTPAVWNGLVSVTETSQSEVKKYYYEGKTVEVRVVPSEYNGKIEAFTYPDILDDLTGAVRKSSGFRVHNSLPAEFHMTYRTKIGNPIDGTDHAYRIHLLYSLKAGLEDVEAKTLGESIEPNTFSWTVVATERYTKHNIALTHLSVDSRDLAPEDLQNLEDTLYGTASAAPSMPNPTLLIP